MRHGMSNNNENVMSVPRLASCRVTNGRRSISEISRSSLPNSKRYPIISTQTTHPSILDYLALTSSVVTKNVLYLSPVPYFGCLYVSHQNPISYGP